MPTKPPVHRPSYVPTPQQQRLQYDQARGSKEERGYDRDWQRCRDAFLTQEPLCRRCKARGAITPAADVHHTTPIAEAPERRLDWGNLEPICRPHHAAAEAEQRRRRRTP